MGSVAGVNSLFKTSSGSTGTAPTAPTVQTSMADWAQYMPQVYETQMKYAPLEAAQQVELAQKYAAPLSQAYYEAQKTMYPEATSLQEQLAKQANAGMEKGLSDWEKQQYQSDLAAQLGGNVGSGIGSDYMSRGMLAQQQNRQDYYRNLGLSVAGLQPVAQAQGAQTTNYMGNYTPSNVMGFNQGIYGTQAGIYGTQANMNLANAQMQNQRMNALIGAGSAAAGSMMMSTRDSKENIVEKDIKALDIIDQLKPVEFNYIGEDEKTYGFIAEDAPDLITAKDKKAVNAYSCIGLLTKAVQELKAEIAVLKGA